MNGNLILLYSVSNRTNLSSPEGEMTLWANLLLQLNPVTLNASQRIHLVSTMADYLHLPLGFVFLFSRRKSFIQQQEKLRLCRQGGLGEKITRGNEKQDALGDVAELLWPVGCQGEDRQNDLAKVLEYSVKAGGVARLLEAPVLGWRVLCAPGVVRHKVKRDLQRLKSTPTPNLIFPLPTQIHQTVKLTHSHSSLQRLLLLPSGAQVDTCPESPMAFKFNPTGNAFATLVYHSDTLDMLITVVKSDMQKIEVSSNSLSSVKQPTLYTCSKDVNTVLEWQLFTAQIILTTLHKSVCAEFGCINPNWFSVHNSQKHTKQAGLSASISEVTSDISLSISEYFWTTELFPVPFLPEHIYAVRTVVGEPSADAALSLLPSSTLHSVYPSLPLTPASYSVASTLTHEAVNRKLLATRLTLRPHPKETPLQTGAYRASHTDSESQPTVSSLGKSAAVDFYMTIWDCSGCLVIQVICCNDMTLFEREPTAEWSSMNRRTYGLM